MQPIEPCTREAPHAGHRWRETGGKRRTYACPGVRGNPADATIRLRSDAFTAPALKSYGWPSLRQAATACGVSPSTLGRAISGQAAPGERLIAALLVGTGRTFDALFRVVAESHTEDPLPLVGGSS